MNDIEHDSEISKSQRKREAHAAQELGERLVALGATKLEQLNLDEALRDAIALAQSLERKHGARKRQLQYIGKLMRDMDSEQIARDLDNLLKPDRDSIKQFHSIENWRDKLVAEGDTAIEEFIGKYTTTNRQALRQLVRNAQSNNAQQAIRSKRKLFKMINSIVTEDADASG